MQIDLDWRAYRSAVWPDVACELRPLRVWAFQELAALWSEAAAPGDAREAPEPREGPEGPPGLRLDNARVSEVARRVLPEHVRNLTGLELRRDGVTAVPEPEALCDEAVLLPLVAELLARLVEVSELAAEPEKN